MIIKFQMLSTEPQRRYGHALFFERKGNPPVDQDLVNILGERFMLDGFASRPSDDGRSIIITYYGEPWFEAFIILCDYVKEGEEYRFGPRSDEFNHIKWIVDEHGDRWYRHHPTTYL